MFSLAEQPAERLLIVIHLERVIDSLVKTVNVIFCCIEQACPAAIIP
jgi:hypothetical protein